MDTAAQKIAEWRRKAEAYDELMAVVNRSSGYVNDGAITGQELRDLRRKANLSQLQVAKEARVSGSLICMIEKGTRTFAKPTYSRIRTAIKVLVEKNTVGRGQ